MTQEDSERIAAIIGECARTHGVSADVARRTAEAVRPSIRFISSAEVPATVGACRLGGLPDLPAGMPWPTFANPDYGGREYPYRFLMQIDLATVAPFDVRGLLPNAGHLFFFVHWEIDDDQSHEHGLLGDESKVIFAAPGTPLRPAEAPEANNFKVYRAKSLSPAVQWMAPPYLEVGFAHFSSPNAGPIPWDFFDELERRIENTGAFAERMPRHRMLGYGNFQHDDLIGVGSELLAQVDTDPAFWLPHHPDDMMTWGDAGTVYYLIDPEDLAAGRFDRATSSVEMG